MTRIATSFKRFIGAIALSMALGASALAAASSGVSLDLASVTDDWHVEGFPSVRLFGAFESAIETALRQDVDDLGELTFGEERKPAWFRPQPATPVAEVSGTPNRLFLEQNYPNPFNPSTMIRYGVPTGMRVKLSVHTLLGSQIRVLVDQWQDPGTYTYDFIAADLPSGAYFYRLQTDGGTITRRMIISK